MAFLIRLKCQWQTPDAALTVPQTLTNCHSACAKNSQNTASINTGKYRKNKLGWVIFSPLRQMNYLSCSQIANTRCSNNVPSYIDRLFQKVSVGWGLFGGKKTSKSRTTGISCLTTQMKPFSHYHSCLRNFSSIVNAWEWLFIEGL